MAALIYQLLWIKQLSLLFGATSQAAAVTFAGFFAGLGAGSWWWGRRSGVSANPLRLYARLEWGIAGTALVYFLLLALFRSIYPPLYASMAGSPWLLLVKLLLGLLLVFPPAFCMGGTLPVIGQVAVSSKNELGKTGALFYALNTVGAALGVIIAAFWMIPTIGYRMTYSAAVLLSTAIGFLAWKQSRKVSGNDRVAEQQPRETTSALSFFEQSALLTMCFVSGFVVLGLEVTWSRIFAQVHENSVYSFATILVVVLVGLAIGAGISSLVARFSKQPMSTLGILVAIGGAFLVASPYLIMHVTDGLTPYQTIESWGNSIRWLIRLGIGGIGYTVVALGTVFPFLMKLAERELQAPGRILGRMLAINTLGAIVGSLVAGFLLLPGWGMWISLQILTAIYLATALLLPTGWKPGAMAGRLALLLALALLFGPANPSELPIVGQAPEQKDDRVLQAWEGKDATVAVLQQPSGHRHIQVNGSYALGSTDSYLEQVNQARIPLYLFPETESICFIGVGTGMSAGAAFDERFPKVKRVVSCELSEGVLHAAKGWIPPTLLGGLFRDERSEILVEDGRHFLMATRETFDMINADLFFPYRRGAGSLYSLEHYRQASERLTANGVFVQWLPLYQLTEREFGVIARTMLEAFRDVTMWRNDFTPSSEKIALIGRNKAQPIGIPPGGEREVMLAAVEGLRWQQTSPDMVRVAASSTPFLYAGNLSKARRLFEDYPINTDDKPVIEYGTSKTFREVAQKDKVIWCVGPKFVRWVERIFEASPLEADPTLQGHPEESLHLTRAGKAFQKTMVSKALGETPNAQRNWNVFLKEWTMGAK